MGEASHQFSPEELDRLEDALENLEDATPSELLEAMDDAPEAVRNRLLEYRALLVATRDALELQDVPPGLLDGVLAQARTAAESEVLTVDPEPADERSWWSRVRKGLLVPVLAVAGSTALILLVVKPSTDDLPSSTMQAEDQAAAAKTQTAEPALQAKLEPGDAADGAEAEAEPEPNATPASPVTEIATSRVAVEDDEASEDQAKVPAGRADAPSAGAGVIGGVSEESKNKGSKADKDAPAEAGEGGSPRWDLIARGDRARRDGDCATARKEYEQALDDADDRVRSRAYAGLGLCEDRVGRGGAAEEFYGRARDLDPEVEGFLSSERPDADYSETRRKSAKPKPKAKSSKKASKFPQADNAFE